MSASRDKLEEALSRYVSDTFSFINSVTQFTHRSPEWTRSREAEIETMSAVQEKMKRANLSIISVMKSQTKGKDFKKLMENMRPGRAEKEQAQLQSALAQALDRTLLGLKELQVFLDAVEKLAVTSVHVFDLNHVLLLSGSDLESVREILLVSQLFCPLLLSFKRDNEVFFKPKLQNLEVMKAQLKKYIIKTRQICDAFVHSVLADLGSDKPLVHLTDVSEEDVEKMLLINALHKIRMDEHFRTLFLFQDQSQRFMSEFRDRKRTMLQRHGELEACALQLEQMNKGAKISRVVGSSVQGLGWALSIIGGVLAPVTGGVSLALVGTGAGLEVLTRVNSLTTKAAGMGVNNKESKKANEALEKIKENVTFLENLLNNVVIKLFTNIHENPVWESLQATGSGALLKRVDSVVGRISASKVTARASKGKAVTKLPPQRQASDKRPLLASAGEGLSALSSLFLDVDVFCIVNNGLDLHNGYETELTKFLSARAALWRSQIDSWQKICDCLSKGRPGSKKNQQLLKTSFFEDVPPVPESRPDENIWTDTLPSCVYLFLFFRFIFFLFEVITAALS